MSAAEFQCCLWHSHCCSSPGFLCQLEKKKKGLPPPTLKYLRWTLLSIALFVVPALYNFCHLRQTEMEKPWSHSFLPSLRTYPIMQHVRVKHSRRCSPWSSYRTVCTNLLSIFVFYPNGDGIDYSRVWNETVNHWPLHCCGLLVRRKLD